MGYGGFIENRLQSIVFWFDNITAIGIGAPGLLDTTKGIILAIANFEWENVHITDTLAKSLQINPSKVFLENDANSALLAELWIGAGKNKQNVVMLTLGTGVGCAIMSDGHLLRGHNGDAGEMGHTINHSDVALASFLSSR